MTDFTGILLVYQTQPSQVKEHKNVLAFWIAHAQLANVTSLPQNGVVLEFHRFAAS